MSFDHPVARQADHPVDPQFLARWSPRAFTDRPVTKAEMMSLLEAARWAPSASNNQPWRFVWALKGEPEFAALLAKLAPLNQEWAKAAAALIVVASKDTAPGRDGAEVQNRWAAFDSGAAWVSLALQARAMGLAAHAMAGFDVAGMAATIGLPEGHTLYATVAVGEQGHPDLLPEAFRSREAPNGRKPLADLAVHGKF